ncbi:MAG: caspase family protein, partial [Phycisphaerales bacterium]|nr:caspase family protein [Phycisphaerales bacterium]
MSTRVAIVANARVGAELSGGTQDASRIFALLTRNDLGCCDARRSRLLANCESRTVFQGAVLEAIEGWNPEDQLVVYFSGHGEVRNGRYVLVFGDREATALPFDALMADLQASHVRRAILILDACFSGAALTPGQKSLAQAPPLPDEIPQGIAMLASSRPKEKSYELEDGSASLFTSLLASSIESGLSGRRTPNGLISVADSIDYINDRMKSEAYAHIPQVPVYRIHGADRDIWIARNPSGDSTIAEPPEAPPPADGPTRTLEELRFLYEITTDARRPCPGAAIDDLDRALIA